MEHTTVSENSPRSEPTISADDVRAMIAQSGLSNSEWARSVAGRAPRTIRKWLAGEPIPSDASDWLRRMDRVEVKATRLVVTVIR
jgi:DNA-binding transcriptional regulator YiaG